MSVNDGPLLNPLIFNLIMIVIMEALDCLRDSYSVHCTWPREMGDIFFFSWESWDHKKCCSVIFEGAKAVIFLHWWPFKYISAIVGATATEINGNANGLFWLLVVHSVTFYIKVNQIVYEAGWRVQHLYNFFKFMTRVFNCTKGLQTGIS